MDLLHVFAKSYGWSKADIGQLTLPEAEELMRRLYRDARAQGRN